MSLTDIFSIPFLICLSICILLIGCSSIFFYQKISQQDHKISSMIGLISTMAEENQAFRLSLSNMSHHGGNRHVLSENAQQNMNARLIAVSDDESSSDDEDSSSDDEDSMSESGSESGSESEDDIGSEGDDENENEIETHVIKIDDEKFNLAKEKFPLFESLDPEFIEHDFDEMIDLDEINEINLDADDFESEKEKEKEKEKKVEDDHVDLEVSNIYDDLLVNSKNNIKSIHLDLEQITNTNEEIKDVSVFKSMNAEDLEISASQSQKIIDTADYKKMSITKLREVISKQGVSEASKLKKNEILKLLGVE